MVGIDTTLTKGTGALFTDAEWAEIQSEIKRIHRIEMLVGIF